MKMTWLHMEFVLNFSPADGRAKLGRTAAKQLLTLASLIPFKIQTYSFSGKAFDKPPRSIFQVSILTQGSWPLV